MIVMSEQNTVYDVVGIGNAIVDVLAKVGDTFLKERNLTKGCMTLVEAAEAGKIYNDIIPEREVSGKHGCRYGIAGCGLCVYR